MLERGLRSLPAVLAVAGTVSGCGGGAGAGASHSTSTATATAAGRSAASTSATTFGGRFYVIGGLRRGTLTQTIVSWAPGEARWRRAGRLAVALADASAVPFGTGVALIGGRAASGRVRTITLFEAR